MRALLLLLVSASMACAGAGKYVWVDEYPAAAETAYRIAPGDVLAVRVFNQDAVSGRMRVRPDGRITLAFLNDVEAAGYAPAALAQQLQTRLKDFINLPVVTVAVDEPRPLVVSALGELARPGTYQLEPGAGVLQALAAGGGLTDFAHKDRIFVVRQHPEPARIRFTWERLARAEGSAASFRLMPGDAVVVE